MSFLDYFSLWNELNTKNQKTNLTEMKILNVNRKVRTKDYVDIHLLINKRLTVALATKYRLK